MNSDCPVVVPASSTSALLQTIIITAIMTSAFAYVKTSYDRIRRLSSRATVVIVGAGPAGLISTLIVMRTGKASRIIVYEERSRAEVVSRNKHVSFNNRSLQFLRAIGANVEGVTGGCWQHQNYVMTSGALLDHLLSVIQHWRPPSNQNADTPVELRFTTKFTRDCLAELDAISERIIAIVCDGSCGRSASLLGLSDEYSQHSCLSYGAVATIERPPACPPSAGHPTSGTTGGHQTTFPVPEIRVHHLTIDVNGQRDYSCSDPFPTSFHLKIFGTNKNHRCMALAVPRCESTIVKSLKVILDQSVMRNVFHACFNRYKSHHDIPLNDTSAIKYMKFSPRLFEIKLLHRMENVAFIEDANIFIVTEGHAARRINFFTGMDINLTVAGLRSLGAFIQQAVCVQDEKTVLQTLTRKFNHGRRVTQEFIRNGLKEFMYA